MCEYSKLNKMLNMKFGLEIDFNLLIASSANVLPYNPDAT